MMTAPNAKARSSASAVEKLEIERRKSKYGRHKICGFPWLLQLSIASQRASVVSYC
jgi:hypothetical protein